MANEKHLKILSQGVQYWNEWRRKHPDILPEFNDADLEGVELEGAVLIDASLRSTNLRRANLSGAELRRADFSGAKIMGANLSNAALSRANLQYSSLNGANLIGADLSRADLSNADLSDADLTEVRLMETNLSEAKVRGAKVNRVFAGRTVFANLDLREVEGIETIQHYGPSEVGMNTIYRSEGQIPELFLRGCGVPGSLILQIPALIAALQPIQFYSCFISYSGHDEEFARHLCSRMRASGLRVWFAPEDIKAGQKLYDQIDRAIQIHDRVLIVLSKRSMESDWVATEIRRTRKVEVEENRRMLFPLRLTDYETVKNWECFDADHGKDLAVELREYFIPDFSNWKSPDAFESAFNRLIKDLRATENRP